MEPKTYLKRYRVRVSENGAPIELRRAGEEVRYPALDSASGQEVTLTVIPSAGLRPHIVSQLEAEAAAAQKISHANIPKLLDFGIDDGHLVHVTEHVDGTSAESWVTIHGPMPAGAVLRIGLQVVSAFGAAAFHGIVHHAINPRNVILVPGQTAEGDWPLVKVIQFFGVAPAPGALIAPGGAVRYEEFASPEQVADGTVDFSSQIYSLGCTLVFVLTGAASGAAAAINNASALPKIVQRLLTQMISPNPRERPQDPLALQEEIRECLEHVERREAIGRKLGVSPAAPVPVAPAPIVQEEAARRPFPVRRVALAAALVLALAVLGALVLPGNRFFRANNDAPIGVPIGVPETFSTAATAMPPPAPEPEPVVAEVPALAIAPEPEPVAPATEPEPEIAEQIAPALEPDAAPADVSTPSVSAAPVVAESQVAASPPDEPATSVEALQTPALASDDSAAPTQFAEPAPPVDLPPPETSLAQVPPAELTNDPPAVAAPAVIAEQRPPPPPARDPVPAAKRSRAPAKIAKSSKPSEQKKLNVANSGQLRRALRRGQVRAQFLGTTPEGDLIFGLPSSERVYASPPAEAFVGEEQRAREVRRALPPVLPALPPER